MVNSRSFATFGIANLNTTLVVQDNQDTNSLVKPTFAEIVMNAQVPETNEKIFLSIEPTKYSSSNMTCC
jgi:hypothetical protein